MSDFQSLLDAVAQVVGGTAPDLTNRPRWYSGDTVGDSSGLIVPTNVPPYPSFKGCYSAPPELIADYPIGIVLPGPFEIRGGDGKDNYWQGSELNQDDLRLWVLLSLTDLETTYSDMTPYRDLVPAQFASHMGILNTANVLQAMVLSGRPMTITWDKREFNALEFVVRCTRLIPRTYTA